jgi:hypothetical protein
MALYLYAGFDTNATTMSVVVAGPASGTATVATGTYCNVSLSGVTSLSGTYTGFAAAVQTALQVVSGGFSCTFSTTTHAFTIAHASNFSLTWTGTGGTNLRRALGFTATLSGTNSYTSTVRPYYVIVPGITARSQVTDVYEPDDIVEEAVSEGGDAYGVAKDTSELWSDWVQPFETKEAVMQRSATAAVPWTWEHFFKHCRMTHPFLVHDAGTNTAHRLRADAAAFNNKVRTRVATDWDNYWSVNLMTRDLGTV